MIRILNMDVLNLQDDVVFHNPAIVLYAAGCKWKCKYCHSRDTWDFNQGYDLTAYEMIELLNTLKQYTEDTTIVGEGGDFFFQLKNWFDFIKDVKDEHSWIKVVWSTGASLNVVRNIFNKRFAYMKSYFDAILCDRPFEKENKLNIKTLYIPSTDEFQKVIVTQQGGLEYAC